MLAAAAEARRRGRNVAFEHDLGTGRHLQHAVRLRRRCCGPARCGGRAADRRTGTPTACRAPASPRPGSWPGRRPAPRRSGRAGPGWPGEVAEVQRAAAVRQPAHDDAGAARSPAGGRCPGSAAAAGSATDCGPRVTTRPQVISGPASPGQQVCSGSRPRSTSSSSKITSWQGARRCTDGLHVPQRLGHVQQLAGVLQAARRLRLLQAGEHAADVAQLADRRRCPCPGPPVQGCRTGWSGRECCNRRAARTAAPDRRNAARASLTAVISSRGDTVSGTRTSFPSRSSCPMKSRRSA